MFLKNIIKFFLLFMGLCIFSSSFVYAETPPKLVYRLDGRPPETIFRDGFKSWGNNNSIFHHVTGASCSSSASNKTKFIATSSSLSFIRNIYLPRFFSSHTNAVAYVYIIRANNSFYSMNKTLEDYIALQSGYDRVRSRYMEQEEWIATRPITPDMIYGVRKYTLKDIQKNITPPIQRNYKYTDLKTSANPAPYPRSGQTTQVGPLIGFELEESLNSRPISACFSLSLWCKRGGLLANNPTDACRLDQERVVQRPFSR